MACVPLLVIGSDECTGDIPEELGNLAKLDQLYLDDNDLTGKVVIKESVPSVIQIAATPHTIVLVIVFRLD